MTIQALHSDVILHVPDGVYGIILGNIHTDHWRFSHLVGENDCIISPICEYFFKNRDKSRKQAIFRLQVLHIVDDIEDVRNRIEVQFQLRRNTSLVKAEEFHEKQLTSSDVVYKLHQNHVEIFCGHFSSIIITGKAIQCCCKSTNIMVFSKIDQQDDPPIADVAMYFTSLHYKIKDYEQVIAKNIPQEIS